MKEMMIYKQNPLTGDWLCYIPGTAQAYIYENKRGAKKFCSNVNHAFERGDLIIDEDGCVKRIYQKVD